MTDTMFQGSFILEHVTSGWFFDFSILALVIGAVLYWNKHGVPGGALSRSRQRRDVYSKVTAPIAGARTDKIIRRKEEHRKKCDEVVAKKQDTVTSVTTQVDTKSVVKPKSTSYERIPLTKAQKEEQLNSEAGIPMPRSLPGAFFIFITIL